MSHQNASLELFNYPHEERHISYVKERIIDGKPALQLIAQPGYEPRSHASHKEPDSLHAFMIGFFIPLVTITCLAINIYYWRLPLIKFIGY